MKTLKNFKLFLESSELSTPVTATQSQGGDIQELSHESTDQGAAKKMALQKLKQISPTFKIKSEKYTKTPEGRYKYTIIYEK